MRVEIVSRIVRRLSGEGALDNVAAVLVARASVDAELAAFADASWPPLAVVAAETPAAA